MTDIITKAQRSALMAKVRSTGNRSTEVRVEAALKDCVPTGWVKHPPQVVGRPDFYFPEVRLAIFVNGCFWHCCPRCGRLPKSRIGFWQTKIEQNRLRDSRVRRQLWREGYHVLRIWEHELGGEKWRMRLQSTLQRLNRRAALPLSFS